MILTRMEFNKLWLDRRTSGLPKVRVRIEHTHPDSEFIEIIEGRVGSVQTATDAGDTRSVLLCIGGKGWGGDGRWVTAFMGSEVTALGQRKHLTITVELLDD